MNENESKYYSIEEIRKFQERGVQVLDSSSVFISRDVEPENILPGCIIHPCSRISGAKTQIHSSAHIGLSGSATIENSWIGENAIVKFRTCNSKRYSCRPSNYTRLRSCGKCSFFG
jgi:bifunctional N-acetylglucosamine-1-phosphate-uridyltransferase/glucosamine-1-phosphate-acetyltransferase GlmU-like protein